MRTDADRAHSAFGSGLAVAAVFVLLCWLSFMTGFEISKGRVMREVCLVDTAVCERLKEVR